jgi:GT2 family glycosyltransferase
MSDADSISVVIPTHQRRERMLALVRAFDNQRFPATRFEVIVSVDGSTDGTLEALKSVTTSYSLRTLSHPHRGRAAALNAGVRVSSGKLIVLLDDDMEPTPGFLHAHWRAHEARTRLGVMGAVPVAIDDDASPATRYVARKFNGHLENLARPDWPLALTDFYSGNFSIQADLLREVGGFDEDFHLYGNEDLELSFRLSRAGVTLAYDASALARQHNDKTFRQLAEDSVAEGRTAVIFALKHPDAFTYLKLGSYATGPLVLRLVRDRLLRFSRRNSRPPWWLLRLEAMLARVDPPGMTSFYRLSLGYLYWIGVREALQEHRNAGRQVGPLARLAKDLRL